MILYDILVNQTPATKEEAMINEKGKEKKRSIFDLTLSTHHKTTVTRNCRSKIFDSKCSFKTTGKETTEWPDTRCE